MCLSVKSNDDLLFLYQQESKLSADSDVDDANDDDISNEILKNLSKLPIYVFDVNKTDI